MTPRIGRRRFVVAAGTAGLGLLANCTGPSPRGQPATQAPRIGYLGSGPADHPAPHGAPHVEAFREGLRELGYIEGENLQVEYRFAALRFEELPVLAADLVNPPVAVVVVADPRGIQPVKQATSSVPVVLVLTTDPVAAGHVASLARPGGNITGLTMAPVETVGKRLELLRDAVPGLAHAGLLYNPADRFASLAGAAMLQAAAALGVTLTELEVRRAEDLAPVFERAHRDGIDGFVMYGDPLLNNQAPRVAQLALAAGLPTVGMSREVAQAGLLMSYAPSLPALFRRAAAYVDKILRGERPADIPVERPRTFELVIKLRTARALRLTIPQLLLVEATELLE